MALDESKESDNVYDIDGFQYVVDKEFIEKSKPIKVDFNHLGFNITSAMDLGSGSGCKSCGTTSSCCP